MRTFTRQTARAVAGQAWGLVLTLVFAAGAAGATTPVVEFDVAQTAICRPVATPDCLKLHTQANLVEVVFELTSRVVAGNESDIKQITYEIRSTDRQLSVVGFLPSTTLQSETVDGVIDVEQHRGSGQLNVEYGIPPAKVQAVATSGGESKTVEKRLAPKSLLLASGTIDRAHGVFFTLHPSTQDSLQKSRPFVCQFEVPRSFRADHVQITCTAVARNRGLSRTLEPEVTAGSASFTVGIYLENDSQAKQQVDKLAARQQILFDQVAAHRGELLKRNETSHWWNPTGKKAPTNMSTQALAGQLAPEILAEVASHSSGAPLPTDVAKAARNVEASKRTLRLLSGQSVRQVY